ncbi:hypothetical protein [Ornithinimicrobium panacihumi]|uniref:hypothetical protein n=1 Tax=Ornithinimicrobium panacihumi TaxID=2008449 RepID=UPI003F8B217A
MSQQDRHPGAGGDEGMRRALDLLAARVGEPDLAATTWRRGRRVRRQRHLATAVGGVATVAVVAATWSALLDRPDAAPAGRGHDEPTGVVSELPPGPPEDEHSVRAQRLWAGLRASCLEAQGLTAWVSDDGVGLSVSRPDVFGLPGVQESKDRCDDLMVLRLSTADLEGQRAEEHELGRVEASRDAAVLARERAESAEADAGAPRPSGEEPTVTLVPRPETVEWEPFAQIAQAYARTTTCLRHNGLPWEEQPPDEDLAADFIHVNGPRVSADETFLPPWHPYAAALEQDGTVEEALAVCPVNRYLSVEPSAPPTMTDVVPTQPGPAPVESTEPPTPAP